MGSTSGDLAAVVAEQQKKRNPTVTAPDGYLVLKLAKEYGRPPEEVENWDAFWFNRAADLMDGENLHQSAQMKEMERRSQKRR